LKSRVAYKSQTKKKEKGWVQWRKEQRRNITVRMGKQGNSLPEFRRASLGKKTDGDRSSFVAEKTEDKKKSKTEGKNRNRGTL